MSSDYITVLAGFLIVLGLMGITLFLMKKLLGRMNCSFSPSNRVNIIEVRYIDPKNKLVLLSRDSVQHLIMVGPNGSSLIEGNITPPPMPMPSADEKKNDTQKH